MKTAFDCDNSKYSKADVKFLENIKKYEWTATHVMKEGDQLRFSYTTGFELKYNAPELIIFALDSNICHEIFWIYHDGLSKGQCFPTDERIQGILDGFDVVLLPIANQNYKEYIGWSNWFYRSGQFRCSQLVFPNRDGAFPWENVSSEFKAAQLDLSGNDWDQNI